MLAAVIVIADEDNGARYTLTKNSRWMLLLLLPLLLLLLVLSLLLLLLTLSTRIKNSHWLLPLLSTSLLAIKWRQVHSHWPAVVIVVANEDNGDSYTLTINTPSLPAIVIVDTGVVVFLSISMIEKGILSLAGCCHCCCQRG